MPIDYRSLLYQQQQHNQQHNDNHHRIDTYLQDVRLRILDDSLQDERWLQLLWTRVVDCHKAWKQSIQERTNHVIEMKKTKTTKTTKTNTNTNKERQRALEDACQQRLNALEKALTCLPNWLDRVTLEEDSNSNSSDSSDIDNDDIDNDNNKKTLHTVPVPVPDDPLFCIGAYEDMTLPHSHTNTNTNTNTVVLTGCGMELMNALTRHAHDFFGSNNYNNNNNNNNNYFHWQLPNQMPIPTTDYRAMSGCGFPTARGDETKDTTTNTNTTTNTVTNAPSWMYLLQSQHYGKTYWDRQLPMVHLITTSSSSYSSCSSSSSSSSSSDPRDAYRQSTWINNGHGPSKWFQRISNSSNSNNSTSTTTNTRLDVLIVTGPLVETDVRPLQIKMVHQIKSFYQNLISSKVKVTIRTRTLNPSELEPNEASRIVIESILPSSRTRTRTGKSSNHHHHHDYVCLGYLSNFMDYTSHSSSSKSSSTSTSSIMIQHGTTQEALHVLQGTLCSIPETLEWMAQHCAAHAHDHAHAHAHDHDCHRLTLPLPVLVPTRSCYVYPYKRLVVKGKNGKKIIQPIEVEKANSNNNNNNNKEKSPTKEQIHAEALTLPFSFLPFYK